MNPERSLRIDDQVAGAPTSGVCTACGHKFVSRQKDIADALEQLRRDWSRHDCDEDDSQAAARIVREATK
jgi:hypothetical protein